QSRDGAQGRERRLLGGGGPRDGRSGSGLQRRQRDHGPTHRGRGTSGLRREGRGLVRASEVVPRLHLLVYFRQEPLGPSGGLKLDQAIAALANTGESSRWKKG